MEETRDITHMRTGETAKVLIIQGGYGLLHKTGVMGLRPGRIITKVGSHFWRGPQIIKIGSSQIAIGFGMAKRIIVQIDKND